MRLAFIYGEFSAGFRSGGYDLANLGSVGLTGSESSFFNLVRSLAERGHEIAVFVPTKEPGEFAGVPVFPIQALRELPRAEGVNAVIAWNEPDYLALAPRDALRIVDQQLNDWPYCRQPPTANVDLFVFPSESSKENHVRQGIPGGAVVPNSVDLELFEWHTHFGDCYSDGVNNRCGEPFPRHPHRVVWASSPDRGLHHLLGMWPELHRRVPSSELHIFYRLEPWLAGARDNGDEVGRRARYIEAALPKLAGMGVTVRGAVSNAEMAREFQQAAVLAYTCDPISYTEGFGCSVLDACAGGCLPIISDADALPSVHGAVAGVIRGRPGAVAEVGGKRIQNRDAWLNILTWALLEYPNTKEYAETQAAMRAHAEAHARERVAVMWERLIQERLGRTATSNRPVEYAREVRP